MIKPPILVFEGGNLLLFTSVEKACSYLEPIDVDNQEYIAFDADARLLVLTVVSPRDRGEYVEIQESSSEARFEDQVATLLRGFLERVGKKLGTSETPPDAQLKDLVDLATKHKIDW